MIDRSAGRGGTFAVVLLMPSLLVLAYGLAGSNGNSVASGIAITASIALLAAATHKLPLVPNLADLLFAAIAIPALAALPAAILQSSTRNEAIGLTLSLGCYIAARRLRLADLPSLRTAVIVVAGLVTAIGAPLTAWALFEQWSDPHGHAIVLGLPSAATMLTTSLGFLIIAAATHDLTPRGLAAWCAGLALPVAIASASMVRFTLMATLGAVAIAAFVAGSRRQRLGAIAIGLTVIIAAAGGLAARHQTSVKFLRQFQAVASGVAEAAIPSAAAAGYVPATDARMACGIEVDNSLAIRKTLLAQTLTLIPEAGPFGLGLDAFEQRACLGMSPHNAILQATIELGWVGGSALALSMMLTGWRLIPIARADRAAAFLLCALAYACALSMVHGRISRQGDVFLLLGAGAGVIATRKSLAAKTPEPDLAQPVPTIGYFDRDTTSRGRA